MVMLSELSDERLTTVISDLQITRRTIEASEKHSPLPYEAGAYLVRLNVGEVDAPRFEVCDVVELQMDTQQIQLGRSRPGEYVGIDRISEEEFSDDEIQVVMRQLRAGRLTDNRAVVAQALRDIKGCIAMGHTAPRMLVSLLTSGSMHNFNREVEWVHRVARPAPAKPSQIEAAEALLTEPVVSAARPPITQENASDFPPPDLRKVRLTSDEKGPASAPGIWYTQMTGLLWYGWTSEYDLAKKRWRRLLPDYRERERVREGKRVRSEGAKNNKKRRQDLQQCAA